MKKLLVVLLSALFVLTLSACGDKKDEKTITVACSPTPHAIILQKAKEILAQDGWNLEIVEYEDYVQPIEVVESGEIDANYFAHVPYLNNYNEENNTNQVVIAKVHYEPFGIYPGTIDSLDFESDDTVDVVIPNDGTNETRALLLLQQIGFIELPSNTSADSIVTAKDVVKYNKNINIVEMEAAQVSRVKDEVGFVILNGNYALQAGLNASKDALDYESADSSAAQTYVNVLATTSSNTDNAGLKALSDVLVSKELADYMKETFEGAVVPFN